MEQKQPPRFIDPENSRLLWLKSLEQADGKRFFRSGFAEQDQAIGAFERATINAVGASTGVGKTAYELSLAYRMAMNRKRRFFTPISKCQSVHVE